MKIINKFILAITIISTFFICSCKDEINNLSASYVKFSSATISASYAGSLNIYVEWSETEWEITKSEGDIIKSLSPVYGGNTTDIDQKTMVVVVLNENTCLSRCHQSYDSCRQNSIVSTDRNFQGPRTS